MTDITQSILAIKSDAQVSVDNDDINKITWYDGNGWSDFTHRCV